MTRAEDFDAVVIGTGQAGKPLAGALAGAGWKTAIVERDRVGGTCIISGCTPTKTMVASARLAHLARRAGDFGVDAGAVFVDMEAVRERKRHIVDAWSDANKEALEGQEGLELIFGEASFSGPRELTVDLSDGGTRVLAAEKVFVNAGARPKIPDIPGMQAVEYLDSTSVMELGEVPEHLVVLGGGFVGLEFAQMFRRFGSRVSILEKYPRLAPGEDEDVCLALREIMEADGIHLFLDVEVTSVASTAGNGVAVRHRSYQGAEGETRGSHLLVATGRTSNTDLLAPETAGLEVDDRGYLVVNDRLETNVPGVYALGDVNGGPPFTHIAYDDFRIIRANLLEGGSASRADRILPYTLFTDPELGRVGMSEGQARKEGRKIKVAKLPMSKVARAAERDETRGFMKVVVDARTDRILGASMLGIEGGEMAGLLQTAMMGDLPYTALRDGIFAHPTLAESLNNLFSDLED
jgi:pyruvate/2-oxoglutarate dehydrogenase complex dihydrolipoamide dehydrogenase (E3) component